MHIFYTGDALDVLRTLESESVHCCVTSPPYWALRNYSVEGQIGLEPTPEEYVEKLVEVFKEVRRVLRKDGTLWLNLGDTYIGTGDKGKHRDPKYRNGRNGQAVAVNKKHHSLKPKDLAGIPWRVAFALQADGWWLRSDIIWHKPNCLPESVKDRPTKSHEYIFLLTKSRKYYYDAEAIKEPLAENSDVAYYNELRKGKRYNSKEPYRKNYPASFDTTGKNRRSVWTINTKPYKGAHFSVFPPDIPELCILAGTSPMACPKCGAPWERVVGKAGEIKYGGYRKRADAPGAEVSQSSVFRTGVISVKATIGWQPTCSCKGNDGSGKCVVLDPFGGAGTTALVAEQLGRDSIYIDIKPEYTIMAIERLRQYRSDAECVVVGTLLQQTHIV